MTTREKLQGLVDELRTTKPSEMSNEMAPLIEMVQLVEGMGVTVWEHIIPQTDAEADLSVDQLIALLLHLRGDDLPPFNLERIVIEAGADVAE